MKKRIYKIIVSCILLIACISTITITTIYSARKQKLNRYDFQEYMHPSQKVILWIGDGMGENHIEVTKYYYRSPIFFTSFPNQGYVSTFSKALFAPTDSAASATALATGQKVKNRFVAQKGNQELKTISESVKEKGMGVGIVTTDSLAGATPACFSAHAKDRGDTKDIILGQSNSKIDLFLGSGKSTYEDYKDYFIQEGYTYTNTYDALSVEENKLIGTFEDIESKKGSNTSPTLEMLAIFAIEFMEYHYPRGYFLMIEGAHIDKRSHKNDIKGMMEYLKGFDEAIQTVYQRLTPTEDVTMIVTADHETGGLKWNKNRPQVINNDLYTRTRHSRQDVKYYIYTKSPLKRPLPMYIDNTDIYQICKVSLGI
ncbi:MAG: alkaline phosphatase [Prevotella sp.]|nr:alkaline phosphatase [Staphylococcus sp.]MCM1350852.1 alkaline phosphatase [Prevotella sp.]